MELLPHAGKAEISWRVHFESPVECAAQCLVRREGVEHGVLLVISIHEFTPDVPGKRLMVSRLASQGCEDGAAQALVVGIMLVAAAAAVLVFLDAEGVGEDAGGVVGRAAGDVAQGIIAAGVVGSGEIGTGGPRRVDTCQLVRAACITIEIALLRAAAIDELSGLQRSVVPGETARATQDRHRYLEIPDSQSYVAHYSRLSRFPAVRQVIDLPGSPHAHRPYQFDTVPTAPRNALEFAPAPHQQGEGD